MPRTGAHIDAFYPGGDVIDFIGHHHYDRNPASLTASAFKTNATVKGDNGPQGIQAWLDYCKSKGKPMSMPEWGLWSTPKGGGGDNPVFIQEMFKFFQNNARLIGYETYFNQDGGDAHHALGPDSGDRNPKASDAYQKLYKPATRRLFRRR